jgi:hypothetical protein
MTIDARKVEEFLRTAARDLPLYNACRAYAWHFDGENNFDSYTNGEIRVLQSLIGDCQVVFDVGANEGAWTETVLTLSSELQVHAFEPSPDTFGNLKRKNLPPSVRLNNVGLGEVAEHRLLYQIGSEQQSELRSLYRREGL